MSSIRLALVTFLVRDYDEAIAWFTGAPGFVLQEDTALSGSKRWVVVCAGQAGGAALLLARAVGEAQLAAVGRQAGDRVGFFLETDDFDSRYGLMVSAGIKFAEKPRTEAYGKVAVFVDLYGNRWDLIGRQV